MAKTSIEWTESSWNPVTGCSKVSSGCKHCYAERMSVRLRAMGQPHYRHGFQPAVHEDALHAPLDWKKPQMIFVNSMSDLFHPDVPASFIESVFDVIRRAQSHRFQVLTKRSERLAVLAPDLVWPHNLWMGVSVENAQYTFRAEHLQSTGARIKFLSLEPLLGPLPRLSLAGIDWVIVGGESGPGARPLQRAWVTEIRDQCVEAGVPFFFKQWGGFNKKKAGRELDGRTWDELPVGVSARG
jgi:protein gp37